EGRVRRIEVEAETERIVDLRHWQAAGMDHETGLDRRFDNRPLLGLEQNVIAIVDTDPTQMIGGNRRDLARLLREALIERIPEG
ncbi:MAG: hypothetical protein JZU55_17490, partial [Afipia sp.]|nr:hypothetical protein [Afipia sp.]